MYQIVIGQLPAYLWSVGKRYCQKKELLKAIRHLWECTLWGVTPLLHFLHEFILIKEHRSKEVAFADDLTVAGNIKEIK